MRSEEILKKLQESRLTPLNEMSPTKVEGSASLYKAWLDGLTGPNDEKANILFDIKILRAIFDKVEEMLRDPNDRKVNLVSFLKSLI